jgi:hypothetical protein
MAKRERATKGIWKKAPPEERAGGGVEEKLCGRKATTGEFV